MQYGRLTVVVFLLIDFLSIFLTVKQLGEREGQVEQPFCLIYSCIYFCIYSLALPSQGSSLCLYSTECAAGQIRQKNLEVEKKCE